jgi:hypothetical protein
MGLVDSLMSLLPQCPARADGFAERGYAQEIRGKTAQLRTIVSASWEIVNRAPLPTP